LCVVEGGWCEFDTEGRLMRRPEARMNDVPIREIV
jgi:hypothetical protein